MRNGKLARVAIDFDLLAMHDGIRVVSRQTTSLEIGSDWAQFICNKPGLILSWAKFDLNQFNRLGGLILNLTQHEQLNRVYAQFIWNKLSLILDESISNLGQFNRLSYLISVSTQS